ncbi:MAG: hypothetical protein ACKOPR_09415 [Chakrabartia godavariana]
MSRAVLALLVTILSAVGSIAFVVALKPVSTGAFVFWALWMTAPHFVLGGLALSRLAAKRPGRHLPLIAAVMSVAGLLYLADVVLWHPDPQGSLAVLIAPLLQVALAATLFGIAWLVQGWRTR